LAGCATEVVDGGGAGGQVATVVADRTGRPAVARCRGGAALSVGTRFVCSVRFDDGGTSVVQVRVTASDGSFDVVAGLPGQPPAPTGNAPQPPPPFGAGTPRSGAAGSGR
jgi:hypothetical protein